MRASLIAATTAAMMAGATGAAANGGAIDRGRAFVQANCARCHAVAAHDASPLPQAPPLRTLHERYPVESLAEAFAEGIVTGHAGMPQFELQPAQIDDLIAYLKSL